MVRRWLFSPPLHPKPEICVAKTNWSAKKGDSLMQAIFDTNDRRVIDWMIHEIMQPMKEKGWGGGGGGGSRSNSKLIQWNS